jgi:hypothetical protein
MLSARFEKFVKPPPVNAFRKLNASVELFLKNSLKKSVSTPGTGICEANRMMTSMIKR